MRLALVVLLVAACRPPGYGKGDGGGDDQVEIDAGVVSPDAPKTPDAAATCTKGFRLEGNGGATTVLVTGSFTTWAGTAPPAIAMMKGGDGVWTGTAEIMAGANQYKFIVDGNWIVDPGNPDQMDDGFGGKNSVVTCVP